jgi:catechol 2,3-dioxygenase-like lactoylglutathione lyase family enzyme
LIEGGAYGGQRFDGVIYPQPFALETVDKVRVYDDAMTETNVAPVQMRVVVEVDDFDDAVRFYRDVLGLREAASFEGDGDARVIILEAGRATFELANRAQVDMIDRVEVGRRVSPHIRLAFEVADTKVATDSLTANGARLIAVPTETPWRSLNSRLEGPANLQLTLFQELGSNQ